MKNSFFTFLAELLVNYDLNFSLFFTKTYHTTSEVIWTTFMALFGVLFLFLLSLYHYKLHGRRLKWFLFQLEVKGVKMLLVLDQIIYKKH